MKKREVLKDRVTGLKEEDFDYEISEEVVEEIMSKAEYIDKVLKDIPDETIIAVLKPIILAVDPLVPDLENAGRKTIISVMSILLNKKPTMKLSKHKVH